MVIIMKRLVKKSAVIVSIIVVLSIIGPFTAMAVNVGGREITSKGASVIDFDTGILLYGHEADTGRVPASMTKLITAYVVYDAINAGEISMDTSTEISSGVSDLSYNWEYSNVPLPVGSSVTIRELMDVIPVMSACAATVALGEAICGSEEAFVARMNAKVESLGITARFYDSYGVSASNNISPRGVAEVTRGLIMDYPEVLEISTKRSVTFRGVEYRNTNQLLGEYEGVDGIKTGYTDAAGYCFVGTAVRDGRRIIIVTMGSTQISRFTDARILLDHGFAVADSVIEEHNRIMAVPSAAYLIINGSPMPFSAYLINGSHYFRLRDIAILLSGTTRQFDVTWDQLNSVVGIHTGEDYSDDRTLSVVDADPVQCFLTPSVIVLDGIAYSLEVYMINSSNYFKLRDLGEMIEFEVDWIEEIRTVIINTPYICECPECPAHAA